MDKNKKKEEMNTDCSEDVVNALQCIRNILILFKQTDPFDNNGEVYNGKVFRAESYSWADEEQPYNFKWKNFEVKWYKYFGRGMKVNRQICKKELKQMVKECANEMLSAE